MAAALPVVGSVIGGAMQGSAAKKAANTQAAAQNQATQAQLQMFNKTQENLKPYMQTGNAANNALFNLMGLGGSSGNAGGYDNVAYQNALNNWQNKQGSSGNSGRIYLDSLYDATQNGFPVAPNGEPYNYGSGIKIDDNNKFYIMAGTPTFEQWKAASGAKEGGVKNSLNNAYEEYLKNQEVNRNLANITGQSESGRPQLSDFPMSGGGGSGNVLDSPLLKAISMDQATLEQTPGYQFNLSQGLKAAQNAAAARGLGGSGAALKGAAQFATGLADSTYQNQFNNAVTNQTNQFNRLNTVAQSGQNAAAGLGGIGQQTAANIANTIGNAGTATAQGIMGSANAISGGLQNAAGHFAGMYGNSPSNSIYDYGSYNPEAASNGLPWSDIRLKENIIPLGYENGFPIYEFSYRWDPKKLIGVMAQDVLKIIPEAVEKVGDFFTVNYSKIGVKFREAK